MPGCKPNDGGSGLKLNDGSDVKLESVGRCLKLGCSWAHRGSTCCAL